MFTPLVKSSLSAVLLFAACAVAFAGEPAVERRRVKYDQRLGTTYDGTYRAAAQIDLGKPIGEFEAYVLASAYSYAHISGCGGAEMPIDRGGRWVAQTRIGYAGSRGPEIVVQKRGGATSSPGRPRVTDPKSYLKLARNI